MTIAVFGAAGFVGRNMVEKLVEENLDFVASDIRKNDIFKGVNFVKADILNFDEVCKVVEGVDYIIHLAASPLKVSLEKPKLNMKINVGGTLNILDAARKFDVNKIIFSSASSIYGDVKYSPVDEKHPCTPKTPYAVAKYMCENYLRVYQEVYGLDYFTFRFFNVYGSWQYPETGALIPSVFKKISANEEIVIHGDGSATRDFIYVGDVVNFFIKVIERDIRNQTVNLGTGKGTSIREIVDICGEIAGRKPDIVHLPQRKGEISNFSADTTKLKEIFGAVPELGVEEGLKHTFEWIKKTIKA
ncbi:MAG: NAD-dependent epimerase/dehydratase family protein [Candidatus Aenigmarchaeota archaeon]|nr:NAD-dependent epimerase/dehydratase family protein [Candidatus Aenigmarchaeota archaeon]